MEKDFVIDASVVLAWCFQDEAGAFADAVLDRLKTATAFAPAVWPLEIGNVLVMAERKKRLDEADSVRFLSLLASLPIVVEQESPERMRTEILSLARKHHLSTYDASYLDLAMRRELPLATLDKILSSAARRCGVKLLR